MAAIDRKSPTSTIRISAHTKSEHFARARAASGSQRASVFARNEVLKMGSRGAGAFGYFECLEDMSPFTDASFLRRKGKKSPVLARFSSLSSSQDQLRDVRNFSVKFYTDGGNYDLIGNNMPIFSNQSIPWSLASLTSENLATVLWTMSDRALPRSYRMMEGFGIHTFRFVNSRGESTYARFHWKPRLGAHGVSWEESRHVQGFDPDYHRRDLWDAIENGSFPVWELGVQLIPEATALKFPFNLHDCTKLIPESLIPMRQIGRLVLNRNPDNFFAEIEQAAFNPRHLVDGIELESYFCEDISLTFGGLADPVFQAQLFYNSQTEVEQTHIKSALLFGLLAENSSQVRQRVLNWLQFVDEKLAAELADGLGMTCRRMIRNALVPTAKPALPKRAKELSMISANPKLVESRKVAFLVSSLSRMADVHAAKNILESKGVAVELVVPQVHRASSSRPGFDVELNLCTTTSHDYDAVFVFTPMEGYEKSSDIACALKFIGQAFKHCKTIGAISAATSLVEFATYGLAFEEGQTGVTLAGRNGLEKALPHFLDNLREHRHWGREAQAQSLPF